MTDKPHPLHVTTEDDDSVLVIRVRLDAFPHVREAYHLIQSTAQGAPEYTIAAFALLLKAVGLCAGNPMRHSLAAVPSANDVSMPLL